MFSGPRLLKLYWAQNSEVLLDLFTEAEQRGPMGMEAYDTWATMAARLIRQKDDEQYALCSPVSLIVDNKSRKSITIGIPHFWLGLNDPRYWRYPSDPASRSLMVAHLQSLCWFDIGCTINAQLLSPEATYGAYFLFKLAHNARGLDALHGNIRFLSPTGFSYGEKDVILNLHKGAQKRKDGWMEINMGDFFIEKGQEGTVQAQLVEKWKLWWKSGLIVEGIEFRSTTASLSNTICNPYVRESQNLSEDVTVATPLAANTILSNQAHMHSLVEKTERRVQSKMIVTVGAKELGITHGSNPKYWEFCSHPDSRFTEVAQLKLVWWLDVTCTVKAQNLSPRTSYGAYLIFKLVEGAYGLESVRGVVRFSYHEARADAANRASLLHLQQDVENRTLAPQETGRLASCMEDGWMEIELGDFIIDGEDDGEVEARLLEVKNLNAKSGLIVEGIEFRPKKSF